MLHCLCFTKQPLTFGPLIDMLCYVKLSRSLKGQKYYCSGSKPRDDREFSYICSSVKKSTS